MKKNKPFGELFYRSLKKTLLTMRIAVILMILGILQARANDAYSQKTMLSLNFSETPLVKVLDKIEDESEFFFLYNEKLLDTERKVSIDAKDQLVSVILDNLFAGTDVKYTIIDRKIILAPDYLTEVPQQQQQPMTGTVTDKNGSPLAGVNVVVTGTTLGVITDSEGKFSIEIPQGSKSLTFSFIGMKSQEINVGTLTQINATMVESAFGLDEVVVVGYGSQKKETVTGAVSQITKADLLTTKSTSVVSNLQGKISGIQIRHTTDEPGVFNSMVSIRGFGTPLVVIDGVVRDGISDFERINPSDIENISILKDASASIFGMNANNGVIIVTTKQGVAGKTKFSYSTFVGRKQPTYNSTAYMSQESAYTYRVIRNEMDRNGRVTPTYTDTELEKWRLGTEPGYQDYNWLDISLNKHTFQQEHNFSFTGGSDKTTYFSSFGYMEDDGLLKSETLQKYRKYNFRTNFASKVTNDLTLKISFAGRFDNQKTTVRDYWNLFKHIIVADHGVGPYTVPNSSHYSQVPAENFNPLAQLNEAANGYKQNKNLQYQSSVDLTYEVPFLKGLTLKMMGAFDGYLNNQNTLFLSYLMYNYLTDASVPVAKSSISNTLQNMTRKDFQAQIMYNKTFAEFHSVSGTLVWEAKSINTNNLTGSRYFDNVYTHDIIDQGSLANLSNSGSRIDEAYLSLLGRFNYDYKSKYLVEFLFREDGSYRYAPSQKWAFFPAISTGWRLSEESFIKDNVPFISNLKLRGSYGLTGEDAGLAFQYIPGYKFSSVSGGYVFSDDNLTLGMIAPGVVNNNMTWIQTRTADIGIDIVLWKGQLSFEGDFFQRNRNGILASRIVSIPNTFGATFPQENLNSDMIRGYDFTITHRGKINSNFEYSISANATYARRYLEYVERAPYQSTMEEWKDMNAGNHRLQGRFWGYKQDGIYTDITQYETAPLIGGTNGNSLNLPGSQKVEDINGDGIIDSNDQLPYIWAGVGSIPPLHFGTDISASWKGLDFSATLQGSAMSHIRFNPGDIYGYRSFPTLWSRYLDRWHPEDPTVNPYDPTTKWIQGEWEALKKVATGTTNEIQTKRWRLDATYLRIKSIELGYSLPSSFCKQIHIDNARIYINTYNLYTFCNKKARGFDPERNEGTFSANLDYPLMASNNIGININF